MPVLRDDLGPVAVYGFGTAERCAPAPSDPVVTVTFEALEKKI